MYLIIFVGVRVNATWLLHASLLGLRHSGEVEVGTSNLDIISDVD